MKTIEEKAKAYDEALERAKKYLGDCMLTRQEYIEKVFPELESKDEKIKESIKKVLANTDFKKLGIEYSFYDMINWLGKQGEQKPQRIISAEAKEALYDKPAWSEEDECYMGECIGAIATKDGWSFEEKRKTKHWLKSMKERCSWKPSDEQLNTLKQAINAFPYETDYLELLYDDLKKLKE